jgi:hypothetical protein
MASDRFLLCLFDATTWALHTGVAVCQTGAAELAWLRRLLLSLAPNTANMLAVDKNQLVQNLKKRALELMQKELQFFVERYTNLATQASIVAGFAFDGLVEMEVPEECGTTPLLSSRYHETASGTEDTEGERYGSVFDWRGGVCGVAAVYYVFDAAAMAFALYTVCVASFCTVYGHRLALQGPTGSVKKSVAVMKKQLQVVVGSVAGAAEPDVGGAGIGVAAGGAGGCYAGVVRRARSRAARGPRLAAQGLYRTFGLSMFSLVMAGVMMAWVKMGQAAALVTFVFIAFFAALLYKFRIIMKLFCECRTDAAPRPEPGAPSTHEPARVV